MNSTRKKVCGWCGVKQSPDVSHRRLAVAVHVERHDYAGRRLRGCRLLFSVACGVERGIWGHPGGKSVTSVLTSGATREVVHTAPLATANSPRHPVSSTHTLSTVPCIRRDPHLIAPPLSGAEEWPVRPCVAVGCPDSSGGLRAATALGRRPETTTRPLVATARCRGCTPGSGEGQQQQASA